MRTYTTLTTGSSIKLLATELGNSRIVATVPAQPSVEPDTGKTVADDLAFGLNRLVQSLPVETVDPAALAEELTVLGLRKAQVNPEPGTLTLSELAHAPAPTGTRWQQLHSGVGADYFAVPRNLGLVLAAASVLPAAVQRSVRTELADVLRPFDGLAVRAAMWPDNQDERTLHLNASPVLAASSDAKLREMAEDEFGSGYATDEVAYFYDELTLTLRSDGFSVQIDPEDARAWLLKNRPHLLTAA